MLSLIRTAPLAASLLGAAALATPAVGQEVVTETNGAWQVVCSEQNRDVCAMRQIGKGAEGNDVLAVTIRALDGVTADNGQPVPAAIDIVTPLGVALRAGVRVRVDGGEERGAPFEVCIQSGCLVRSPMSEDFLNEMKRGSNAAVTVVSTQQGEVTVNISLNGFTKSFNTIE